MHWNGQQNVDHDQHIWIVVASAMWDGCAVCSMLPFVCANCGFSTRAPAPETNTWLGCRPTWYFFSSVSLFLAAGLHLVEFIRIRWSDWCDADTHERIKVTQDPLRLQLRTDARRRFWEFFIERRASNGNGLYSNITERPLSTAISLTVKCLADYS